MLTINYIDVEYQAYPINPTSSVKITVIPPISDLDRQNLHLYRSFPDESSIAPKPGNNIIFDHINAFPAFFQHFSHNVEAHFEHTFSEIALFFPLQSKHGGAVMDAILNYAF